MDHQVIPSDQGCHIVGPPGVLCRTFEIPLALCLVVAEDMGGVAEERNFYRAGSSGVPGLFLQGYQGYLVLGRNVKYHGRDGHWEAITTHIRYEDVPEIIEALRRRASNG